MNDFLSKPIDMGQLLKKLGRLLGTPHPAKAAPQETDQA
jgi:hypothetical protein